MARRGSVAERFGRPVNLGPAVNGPEDDVNGWLSPDGRFLYFASDRQGGHGFVDIYRAPIRVVPTGATIKPADGWVDLLSQVDVKLDAMRDGGTWSREGAAVKSAAQQFARVAVPVRPKGDYQLRAEFTRRSGDSAASFFLPVGDYQVLFVVDGWDGKGLCGLQSVEGNDAPDPAKFQGFTIKRLVNGQRCTVTLEIKQNGKAGSAAMATISAQVQSGGAGGAMNWTGPSNQLSLVNPKFSLGDSARLGLAAWESTIEFHSLELKMTSGEATRLRP
jgi:hypothetical protein